MAPYELGQRLYKAYGIALFLEEKPSGCWECYDRKPTIQGYIRLNVGGGKLMLLHRLVLNITSIVINGVDDIKALHNCDNPACINPKHLRWGTQLENIADMVEKGRGQRVSGTATHMSKFSAEQIRMIRASNRGDRALARTLGVMHTTIRNIRMRISYQDIA